MGIHDKIPDGSGYNEYGNAVMRSATPGSVVAPFLSVLKRSVLPEPFEKSAKLLVTRWMPHIDNKISLPAIAWKVIHTSPSSKTELREKYTHTKPGPDTFIKMYQQNFDHIIQFECYAATQEEAETLEWWFVRLVFMYRNLMSFAGAQAWRYLEAREDFLVTLGQDKYPARPVRFAFTTAMTFPVVSDALVRVDTASFISNIPIVEEETVTRGEDVLTFTNVDSIIEVTSIDGSIIYYPTYDRMNKLLTWSSEQQKPATGAQYIVKYIHYGSEAMAQEILA